jgi:hypothetical protein
MKNDGSTIHQVHPHNAMHMPHPAHWIHEHHMAVPLMVAALVILLIAGLTFFAARFGGSTGLGGGTLMHPQFPYYPYY